MRIGEREPVSQFLDPVRVGVSVARIVGVDAPLWDALSTIGRWLAVCDSLVESVDEFGFWCEVFEAMSDDAVFSDDERPFLRGKSPFIEYRREPAFAEVALNFVRIGVEVDVDEIDFISVVVLQFAGYFDLRSAYGVCAECRAGKYDQ